MEAAIKPVTTTASSKLQTAWFGLVTCVPAGSQVRQGTHVTNPNHVVWKFLEAVGETFRKQRQATGQAG